MQIANLIIYQLFGQFVQYLCLGYDTLVQLNRMKFKLADNPYATKLLQLGSLCKFSIDAVESLFLLGSSSPIGACPNAVFCVESIHCLETLILESHESLLRRIRRVMSTRYSCHNVCISRQVYTENITYNFIPINCCSSHGPDKTVNISDVL